MPTTKKSSSSTKVASSTSAGSGSTSRVRPTTNSNPSPKKPSSSRTVVPPPNTSHTTTLKDKHTNNSENNNNNNNIDADASFNDLSMGMSSASLSALLENFDLEVASQLRRLQLSLTSRIGLLTRHSSTFLSTLDPQVGSISLGRLIDEFGFDTELALRSLVGDRLRAESRKREEGGGVVEQSGRKRKRVANPSPSRDRTGPLEEDVDDIFGTIKKPRNVPGSTLKSKTSVSTAPSSILRGRTTRNGSPAERKSRPTPSTSRLAPSTISHSDNTNNFIYRVRGSISTLSTALPPTPSHHKPTSTVVTRKPRRGESILMRSVNDSPLGECVASDVEEEEVEDDGEEEEEEEEGWDLMSVGEASRVEEIGRSSTKGKGKGKVKARTTSSTPTATRRTRSSSLSPTKPSAPAPTATSFAIHLPEDAPNWEQRRKDKMKELQDELEKTEMGEKERKRLLMMLETFF